MIQIKSPFMSLVDILRPYATPMGARALETERAQHTVLGAQLPAILIMVGLSAGLLLIALLTASGTSPGLVSLWYVAAIAAPALLFITIRKTAKSPASRAKDTSLRKTERYAWLIGVIWGLATPLFAHQGGDILVVAALLQIGTSCGLAILLAALPRIVLRCAVASLIPLAVVSAISASALGLIVSIFAVFMLGAIFIGTRASAQQLQATLIARADEQHSQLLLQSSMNTVQDAFAVYAPDGQILIENTAHSDWKLDYLMPASQNGQQVRQTRSGHWIEHRWQAVPGIGTASLHRDVTSLKQRDKLLIEAREQAAIASETQARFLSCVSQELRTPLNSVLGFSELLGLASKSRLTRASVQEYADYINASGQHLLALVDDIIDYTRIGLEVEETAMVITDIQPLISEAIALGRIKAGVVSEHKVVVRLHEQVRMLHTNPKILARILANIISNAIKFSASDSKIAISSSHTDAGQDMITIRDFGTGMTREQIQTASTAVFQADPTSDRRHGSTGMGLAIVHKLARLIDMEVNILSKPGRGTAVMLISKREADAEPLLDLNAKTTETIETSPANAA